MSQTSHAVRMLFLVFVLLFSSSELNAQPEGRLPNLDQTASHTDRTKVASGRSRRMGRTRIELFYSGVYYYELRGTLMTPEAIRAVARLEQLRRHLTDDETRTLVTEAEKIDGLVVYIELNPREGSGVIPLDWRATLRPKGAKDDSPLAIAGTEHSGIKASESADESWSTRLCVRRFLGCLPDERQARQARLGNTAKRDRTCRRHKR